MLEAMDLYPFELRSPARLMTRIATRVPLTEGSAYVALVHHPSTTQRLLDVRRLDLPAVLHGGREVSDALCDEARSFGIGWTRAAPEHLLVTVVVRAGRCVTGRNEAAWCQGWRYANHLESLHTGDLILVTEHGWLDLMSTEAGHEPRLAAAG